MTKGPDQGAYRHEDFHRDQPDICRQMKRSKQKNGTLGGRPRSNSTTSMSSTGSPALSVSTNNSFSEVPDLTLSSDENPKLRLRHRSLSMGQIEEKPRITTGLSVLKEHKSLSETSRPRKVSFERKKTSADCDQQALALAAAGMVAEHVNSFNNVIDPAMEVCNNQNELEMRGGDKSKNSLGWMDFLGTNNDTQLGNLDMDLDFSKLFDSEKFG